MFKWLKNWIHPEYSSHQLRELAENEEDEEYKMYLLELADKNYSPRLNKYYIACYKMNLK